MATQKFYSPLKAGLFIVVLSYFLFALHDTFTLSWIGEWNRFFAGHFIFEVYAEDIIGFVGTLFRFAAGIIAIAVVICFFAKKVLSKPATFNAIRLVVVFEGIYWALAFLPTAYFEVKNMFFTRTFGHLSTMAFLNSFATNALPVLVESIALPIFLFILAYKLSPSKPLKVGIRWGMITGTLYVFVFWLLNTTIWISVINEPGKGTAYLTSYPQYFLSFILSAIGLLLLGIYAAGFTVKSRRAETLQELRLKTVGVIILALGIYFLWNYLTWIFFGGWSNWFAWFLGHNEDLWALSLPMLGLPLLFSRKTQQQGASF
ncbi:MAG: hypothetical protein ABSF44_14565 [Candidatus Bathyarchaeia archaeon]|jgi:hypothetical protein